MQAKAPKFVAYLRVSTDKQGRSGLGLEAQRQAIADFLAGGKPIAEYVEIESGRKTIGPSSPRRCIEPRSRAPRW